MLVSLRILHFAIIDQVTIDFDAGLSALTGETGAGKSILVDAINLVLGGRASADLIRTGEDAATVEALFQLDARAKTALEEAGVAVEGDELLVKRVVSRSGKNKVLLNGGPATLAMLGRLGPRLIDISGQHEHQSLLDPAAHREAVDSAGGHGAIRERMAHAFAAFEVARREAEALAAKDADRARREDYLRFQVEELRALAPKTGEDGALVAERSRLFHAETLAEAVTRSEESLYSGEGSVAEQLKTVAGRLAAAAKLDSTLAGLLAPLASARVEVEEVARTLRDRHADEADPGRLAEIEDRLATLERLRKKHGVPDAAALEVLLVGLERELAELASFEEALAAKRHAEHVARQAADAVAVELTKARTKSAKRLAVEVERELAELGMAQTRFEVAVRSAPLSADGADEVEFRIAPNPGEEPKALARIASGGELSRVMLALKCVVAGHHPVATYVFDEVDAGIGGAIAERIGKKLAAVADGGHQVLCITHLPQVASCAKTHVRVSKRVAGGRTSIQVEPLDAAAREEEIARMLGGVEITAATRAHAREMLARGDTRESQSGAARIAARRAARGRRAA